MASTSTSGRGKEERDPFLVFQPPNKKIKSPSTAKQYDVFINHRGPDTKANLAKPLYDSLQQAGIRAYLDFEETELGDYFPSAMKDAIFSARLHIAILSPRYAESPWCLAELALMFQTRARIIPLFYNVDPSDFRYIKNGVADAFSKHQEKRRYPDHDIQRWKDCLQNVSRITGYQLNGQNDNLKKLCEDIMSAVVKEKQKRKTPFQVAKHEVGLDELAKDFHSHCQRNGQMGNNIIGIYGMGGSGKTTLAKYLFNRKHSEFSGSTILFDVREKDVKGNLTLPQQKLVNDLKGNKNEDNFCSTEDGIAIINEFLENSKEQKFLIVIDDVDRQKQLDALLPTRVLNPDSLVIVTTRDKRLLINAGVTVLYKMKKMNAEHSRELFCCHAFHRQHCKIGFEDLVDGFVEACEGLPLALRVMGGHVFGSDKAYWKLQLDAVKARLHKDIRDTLKISYDYLEEEVKQVFMDLACFFIGVDVSMAMSVWKASGWRAEHALQTLKDKCLAEVETCFDVVPWCHYEPRFFLRMHDQLRDLGRAMADNETTRRRRLWRPEDHIAMNEIKGFQDGHIGSAGESFRCYRSASNLETIHYTGILVDDCDFYEEYFLEISKTSTYAQSLILNNANARGIEWIPEWISLQNLHSLSLYGLSPARLLQRDNQVALKLKELYCSFYYDPDVNRDMLVSELVSSFGTFKQLESLHLRSLDLSIEWNQLLKSVRDLTNLQTLDLRSFTIEGEIALSNRGETIDDRLCMRSLEAITLCQVCETTKVSIHGQFCPTLKSLKLCSMVDLIEVDLIGVTSLECLVLLQCEKLRKVLGNYMAKLEMFQIRECKSMREFPNFERASSLKRIYISHCDKLQDISGIERLTGLKRIWIADCPELKSVKAIEQLKGLKRIWIQLCPQLEGVICFKELKELKRIFIGGCTRLQNIHGIEYLSRLESIIITACPKLQNISGIEELEGLKEMIIAVAPITSYVRRLQKLASECTILVGKLASDRNRVKRTSLMLDLLQIGDILTVGYGLVNKEEAAAAEAADEEAAAAEDEEAEDEEAAAEEDEDEDEDEEAAEEDEDEHKWESLQGKMKQMRDSFRETQRSLSMMIICIATCTNINHLCNDINYPSIGSNICNGSNIRHGSRYLFEKSINLIPGCCEYTLYTAIVDDCWRSEYESWMPFVDIRWAFIMGVEAGEERKTLQILERIITQLCVDCSEDVIGFGPEEVLPPHSYRAEYDELAEYADDDEKYDGSDDDGEHNIHSIIFKSEQSTWSFHGRKQERYPVLAVEPPNRRESALSAKKFDVFINHQGPDIKTSLAKQLYDSLQKAGIQAYVDSAETQLGDFFTSAVKNAIFSAVVHIAILSSRYAESARCLAELDLMFHSKARIIPLFYHVHPSDLRYIKNEVADAFSKHEKSGRYSKQVIEQWKERLQNVSGIKGYELINGQNDDVDLLCASILSVVKNEENPKVGLDELVEDFERHCEQNRELKDNVIGIYGMGGSGKTTLANELFNRKRSKYVRLCALFGVREAFLEGDLTSLQTKLLNDLFYQNLRKFSSKEEGVRSIKRYLGKRPSLSFLILIDDVDQKSQLDDLLSIDMLNSNSLVIITTRDERVLIDAGIRVRYKIKGMDQQHSRQLFCWHAFHKPDLEIGYEVLVERFVKECAGIPLSLQVLGEHVSGRSKKDWESELGKRRLPDKIKDVLKVSYYSLGEEEKQIFMDIACFFTEKDQSIALRIWKASEWKVEHALQILSDRSLVEVIKQDCWNEIIDEESPAFVFRMHNHLRDLGREMADHGENLRLWSIVDPEHQASTTFKAILTEAHEQRHRCFNSIYDESITYNSITFFIENSGISTNLQWLELNGSEGVPSWIPLEKLEGLRIRGRSPRKLWEAPPSQLKELVCKFTNCGWMEKATLRRNWNEFTDSLGILSGLESLVIHLESQENRKDIVIEWKSFVESVRKLNCLKTLGLSGLYINGEIAIGPSSEPTEANLSLEAITLSHIGHTSKVSISGPSVKSLKLKHMVDLTEVNLSGVETLGCLELFQCGRLTKVLADALPKLEILSVERCWEIQELPNLCYSELLEGIKITRCEELQNIKGIEKLLCVDSITITCCPTLQNIRGLNYLKGLKYMILSDGAMPSCVSELQELPSEFTVVMGRAATSFPQADEIAGIAEALPVFQESSSELTVVTGGAATTASEMTVVNEFHKEEAAYKILQLLSQETQPSLSAVILCAMVDGEDDGSKYMVEGRSSQTIDLSWAGGKWIYTILVNSRKQIYSAKDFSWMPTSCKIENGYILSVKEGPELKTLSMLKRLTERLYRTDT